MQPYATNSTTVTGAAQDLRAVLETAPPLLERISDAQAAAPRRPGGWSRKEILGHLLDSAANNHHRFVRAQMEAELVMPGYAQEEWVSAQKYQGRAWSDLIAFWILYNRHLAHVMETAPPATLQRACRIGGADAVTLEFLMIDYVVHLKHHLAQILGDSILY